MTMPYAHGHDSAERVEVSAVALVLEVLRFPFHEHDRFFVVEKNSGIQKFFAKPQHFVGGRAACIFWACDQMAEAREVSCRYCG
jgi:hypothetical protein